MKSLTKGKEFPQLIVLIVISNTFQVNLDHALFPTFKYSTHFAAHTLTVSTSAQFFHHEAMKQRFFLLKEF
jgi:hypothetical protein